MRAGLDASTVTPGSTAPDVSRTSPAMAACAHETVGKHRTIARNERVLTARRIESPPLSKPRFGQPCSDRFLMAPPARAVDLARARNPHAEGSLRDRQIMSR